MSIKSKIFNYGHEHEAEWPPLFGSKDENTAQVYHWDEETKSLKEGHAPNRNNQFGQAPSVIFDSMPPTYHEGACRTVESRKEWERLDKETGSITFGSINEPRKHIERGNKEQQKELKADRRRAALEAIRKVRANPKEIRQKFEKQAEKQLETAKKSGLTKLLKEKGVV